MKRFFILIAVLIVFFIYSIGIRHQRPRLTKPTALIKQSSPLTSTNSSTANSSTTGSNTTNSGSNTSGNSVSNTSYKDGTYTGSVADAYYGQVQVQTVITNGKISDVKFLSYPNSHSTSVYINQQAMPYLKQEAIQSQNANVQIISGATFTTEAFIQSLTNALSKAHA